MRALNASLPRERQIRVLLGDPPVDWDRVKSKEEYERLPQVSRDRYATEVIRREVLAKGRRALLIYGDLHFVRKHAIFNYERSDAVGGHTIVSLLEESTPPTQVFTVWANAVADLEKLQTDVSCVIR